MNHSEVYGEDDGENKRHKSTKGDGQPNGTAIERTGSGGILRRQGFRVLACWQQSGGQSGGGRFLVDFWTSRAHRVGITGRIFGNGGTRIDEGSPGRPRRWKVESRTVENHTVEGQ
jgi:hypothetical protein